MFNTPVHGSVVEYCLPSGEWRAAIVLRGWTLTCATLRVLADPFNDGADPAGLDWCRGSAMAGQTPGCWRWILFPLMANATAVTANAPPPGTHQVWSVPTVKP